MDHVWLMYNSSCTPFAKTESDGISDMVHCSMRNPILPTVCNKGPCTYVGPRDVHVYGRPGILCVMEYSPTIMSDDTNAPTPAHSWQQAIANGPRPITQYASSHPFIHMKYFQIRDYTLHIEDMLVWCYWLFLHNQLLCTIHVSVQPFSESLYCLPFIQTGTWPLQELQLCSMYAHYIV